MLLLLATPLAWGANGDIIGANVQASGWQLDLYFANYIPPALGATRWAITWATNYSASSSIVLTVRSPGFDTTGASNSVIRTIYGTKGLRNPWYGHTNEMSEAVGSDVKATVGLSDYIYSGDTITAMSIAANVYSNNAAQSGFVPTNSSTMLYPKTSGGFTWPGGQLWRTPTGRVRAFAFSDTADNGRPVECMKFIVTGCTSGVRTTNIATMTIDRTLPDPVPTGEYVADIPLTPFTEHELVRLDFQAFPRIGTTATVLDTTLDTYTWPSWLPCSVTNRVDTNNSYSSTIAVVDPVNGNDANGRATISLTPQELVSGNLCFSNICVAVSRCVATNNAHYGAGNHNDAEGVIVYVRSTVTNVVASASTFGNAPRTWLTIQAYPGDAWPTLTNSPSTARFGTDEMTRYKNIDFTGPTKGNLLAGSGTKPAIWFDQCVINANPCAAICANHLAYYFTHNTMADYQQVLPGSAMKMPAVVRGNNFTNWNKTMSGQMVLANKQSTTNGLTGIFSADPATTAIAEYGCFYNNLLYGMRGSVAAPLFLVGNSGTPTNAYAFVQNVFEYITNAAASLQLISSDSLPSTNFVAANNTFIGCRMFFAYNSVGTAAVYREHCTLKNNVFDDFNIKADLLNPGNTNRTGNWSAVNGVGCTGNLFPETAGVGAPGDFMQEFPGMNCGALPSGVAAGGAGTVATQSTNYIAYMNRQAYDGASAGTFPGLGDYRYKSYGPGQFIKTRWMLPYDIEGNARGDDPPGAYCSANPRKAAGFFFF